MTSFFVDLADLHIISVKGEQRRDYLHGQLTIDTKQFDTSHARLGAHCDFKGKMWSVFNVFEANDSFYLIAHKDASQASLRELKKYGVFSKVVIETEEKLRCIGAYGEQAAKIIKALFPQLDTSHMSLQSNEFGQCISFNDANQRYLLVLSEKGVSHLKELAEELWVDKADIWNALEIDAAIPSLQSPNINEFVPQMMNLHALNAIDFDKGCYMGQEVVARTKFLGKNKRALYLLTSDTSDKAAIDTDVPAGAILEKQIGDNWRRGGTVVRSAQVKSKAETCSTRILAVLSNDTEVGDVLRLKESEKEFQVQVLPYALEQA
uniref:tRNA-modifying protein YgfZ n=1 Tax=Ningiella ruwaisensis TaxID=2364274 RepID=UPI00109F0AD4|nr:tRNA-modifying protein YgfZ [Ningiella ruwaisensis]